MTEEPDYAALVQRARAFLTQWDASQWAHTPTKRDAVIRDGFDEHDWDGLIEDVPSLADNVRELGVKHDYVEDFFEDFFNLLHQGDPMLRDNQELAEQVRPNRTLAEMFDEMPEVESLRLSTMHDRYSTAMAMLSMQSKLNDAYSQVAESQAAARHLQEMREQAQQHAQDISNALTALSQDPGDEAAQQALSDALAAAEAAGFQLIDAQTAADAAAADATSGLRAPLRQAAGQAAKDLAEEDELMRAFGVEDGELQHMSFDERRKLSERLKSNRLAKFAKLIGQFRAIQQAESRRKVVHTPDMIVGVEFGSDLMRVTPAELMNLGEPGLEDDFWLRYADGRLLTYKLEGTEKMGQGPIIVVCDESGSMQGGYYGGDDLAGGSPEAWSKALSLALNDQARRGHRDFHYIGFSSQNQQWHSEFPKGKAPLAKVIEFTEHFYGGGTHYETPLLMALDIVEREAENGRPKPDIVFITDDEYRVPNPEFLERWQRARHEHSMRVYGVVIGRQSSGALDAISDNVRSITSVSSDPSTMRDVFQVI